MFWVFGQLTFLQFYNPEFMRGFGVGVLNGALWTIAVELQFYVLTPVLVWLLMRRRSWFVVALLASMAINIWLRLAYDWSDIRIKLLSVSFLPWVYMFMIGALTQVYRHRLSVLLSGLGCWRWVTLLIAYLASMVLIGNVVDNSSNSIHPLAFLLLCALVFHLSTAKLFISKHAIEFFQRNDYSYGIYIFHTPVLNVTLYLGFLNAEPNWQLLWINLIPMLLAALSWHIIEKRALGFKGRL
jgi:peptidoglycan/LPS O-acetylase OafA/YrhL